jgi:predicted nucleic acid-binding protein
MNTYIIDANVLFSSLITGNKQILAYFAANQMFMPDFAFQELQEHQEMVLKKTKLSRQELRDFSIQLLNQITVIPNLLITTQSYYQAFSLCRDIDPKDLTYVALAIEFDYPLLTRDKPLATGLRANGFTNVVLLDELIGE